MAPAVGIDLGTTFSVIAYVNANGQPEVIPNLDGDLVTPSVVDFSTNPPLVGYAAKERQAAGSSSVAAFFKRIMLTPDEKVEYFGREYGPIEMSAQVLEYLKRSAEAYLGEAISEAVITVPAYFQNVQREATIEAGRQAGLNVLRIINEPTAAALAYQLKRGRILVYDLGGGTFDVTVVDVQDDRIDVLATGGDHQLGGRDWDDRLLQYVSDRFSETYDEDVLDENLNELLIRVEQAKRALSQLRSTVIRVDGELASASYAIDRQLFESLTRDLVERTQLLAETVLHEANCTWTDLTGVLLVGGSTRMPMIREFVKAISGKNPLEGIHPDHVVALGAALEAARIADSRSNQLFRVGSVSRSLPKLNDVTAHSLGMIALSPEGDRYVNSIIIPKQSRLPASQTRHYDFQTHPENANNRMEIFVTQGESENPLSELLSYLDLFVVTGFTYRDEPTKVQVTLSYDQDGLVAIQAKDLDTGQLLSIDREPLPEDIPARFASPPTTRRDALKERLTVYIVIDISGSMRGEPLREAKLAAHEFVRLLQPDEATRIGLMTVGNTAVLRQAATTDASEITSAINALQIPFGEGNQGQPFDLLYKHLAEQPGRKFAIVLADGKWVHQYKAIQRAKISHRAGIEIIGIAFGVPNKAFLDAISSTGRESLFAPRGALTDAFGTIARELLQYRL